MKDISKGFIALYRQFTEWEWFTDINTCHLFLYCLLRANHKDTKWRGIELKKGSFVTSYEHLASSTGLSVMQVRTALRKLKLTGEITNETSNQNSIIIVNNYKKYQDYNTRDNTRDNNQITTDNNDNKERDINISLSIEEREILKNYVLKNKLAKSSVAGYVNTLIRNGDYQTILEEEKKRGKKKNEVKNKIKEDFLKVKNKKQACYFIGLYGDFEDKKHPKEVKEVMEKYKIESYTEATEFLHKKGE